GKLLGWFDLGQPLTAGGAYQPGRNVLYFPGDSDCIFVLDPANRAQPCPTVLHTHHGAGTVRSAPLVIARRELRKSRENLGEAAWPDLLILEESAGLEKARLRAFELPIKSPEDVSISPPELQLSGWSWFPAYHDAEKLAQTTDAAKLAII